MKPNAVFAEFVAFAGGPTAASRLIGVTYGMVDHILKGRRGVSKRLAEKVDTVSSGRFSKSDLMFGRPAVANGDVKEGKRPQSGRRGRKSAATSEGAAA